MEQIATPKQLGQVWPEIAPWIAAAVAEGQGDENTLDVLIAVARGSYSLWYEKGKFAAVVQVTEYPRQNVATILYCGGSDLEQMKSCLEWGKGWCREHNVQAIRVWGRRGWERVLGMTKKGVILQESVV